MCGTKTTQTNQYDQGSMSAYQGLQPDITSVLQQYMNDPFKNAYFNQALGLATNQATQLGQRGMSNLWSSYGSRGFNVNNPSAFMASQLARQQRATSGLQSNAMLQLLPQFEALRQGALGQAQQYRPLQTGQTQQTSGLGTWLPQVIGATVGGAMALGTGGMSSAGSLLGGRNPQATAMPWGYEQGIQGAGMGTFNLSPWLQPRISAFGR